MKLSNAIISKSKPREKNYRLSDGDGLHLLVHSNGSKYWQFRYRFSGKERPPLSLGKFPDLTLKEARDKRTDAKRLIRDGIDPQAQRKKEKLHEEFKNRNLFETVAKEWHDRKSPKWTNDHAITVWQRLENHVFPWISKRPIAEITSLELLTVIQKIEAKGLFETAHRVLHICDSIFRFAIITARMEINPAPNLRDALSPNILEHLPAIHPHEAPAFFQAFRKLTTNETYKLAFRLLALCVTRTGELRHAQWPNFDIGNSEWIIPANYTKCRREHVVPLPRQAIIALRELAELDHPGPWLFPNCSPRKHPVISENAINNMISKMGYKGRMVGHGFRSLFSTVTNEAGFNPDAIERQLAHVEGNSVRAAYNRALYLPERRKIMQWWANWIEQQHCQKQKRVTKNVGNAQELLRNIELDRVIVTPMPTRITSHSS